MWTVKLSQQAAKFLRDTDAKFAQQLNNGLFVLSKDPYVGKCLKGELKGYWSYRVGMFRIVYSVKKAEIIIEILRIHNRKDVYEKLRRL